MSVGTQSARRLQNLLVAGELAFCVILVTGAALLAQSFAHLYRKGPGFQSAGPRAPSGANSAALLRQSERAWGEQRIQVHLPPAGLLPT